jgi:hypothetical protein
MTAPANLDVFVHNYDEALERGIGVSGETKEYFARGRVSWLVLIWLSQQSKTCCG